MTPQILRSLIAPLSAADEAAPLSILRNIGRTIAHHSVGEMGKALGDRIVYLVDVAEGCISKDLLAQPPLEYASPERKPGPSAEDPRDYAIACLRNSGVDVTCGMCMEVAFTGVATPGSHTCKRAAPGESALATQTEQADRFMRQRDALYTAFADMERVLLDDGKTAREAAQKLTTIGALIQKAKKTALDIGREGKS